MKVAGRTSRSTLRLLKAEADCENCNAWKLCFTEGSKDTCSSASIKGLIEEKGPIPAGEIIYQRGDKFRNLYAIQSGLIKTETESLEGRSNVTGFYTSGDLFGLEGIGSSSLPGRAMTIVETWLCEIPYESLLARCQSHPELHHAFTARLGQRIQNDEYKWKTIRNESSDRRALFFLNELHQQQSEICGETQVIELAMSKRDIANFLGLTPESLSRAFHRLEDKGLIEKIDLTRIRLIPETVAEVLEV